MLRIFFILLAACVCGAAAFGAEVTLRRQATLAGSVVLLGDVADVAADDELLVRELAAVALLPAPAPGTKLFLGAAQLRDLLKANGVDVDALTFRGADAVAVSTAAKVAAASAPNGLSQRPTREAVAARAVASIVEYLIQQTGHDLWNVTVDADGALIDAYWKQGANLWVSGGKAPWTGRQRFVVSGADPAQATSAYATVERLDMIVFATRTIAKGDFLRATDVELRPYSGSLPALACTSIESVVGKETIQAIRPDAMVLANYVRSPLLVRRGERVEVRARAAGVVVTTLATAGQDGGLGDLIRVQPLEGKEQYVARVTGSQQLEIFAAGASAQELNLARRAGSLK